MQANNCMACCHCDQQPAGGLQSGNVPEPQVSSHAHESVLTSVSTCLLPASTHVAERTSNKGRDSGCRRCTHQAHRHELLIQCPKRVRKAQSSSSHARDLRCIVTRDLLPPPDCTFTCSNIEMSLSSDTYACNEPCE